jgi:SulP family sulfate permease
MPFSDSLSPSKPEEVKPSSPPGVLGWLCRYVPAFDSLRTYSRADLVSDLLAGLTVATVAVPQAMAYALLAGLPPHYGLYTAIIMTAVGALFDSSRQLINGPTNAISIALLSALAFTPEGERASAVALFALLVSLVQLGITVLRLGDLTRYVSHAVIVGFTLGAGMLIVLSQFKNLVGLPGGGAPEDPFLKRFWLTLTSGTWDGPTALIGLGTIAIVVGVRGFNGWMRRRGARFPIPQHLVAVIVMAFVVWAFELDRRGVGIVGDVPAALPSFELPRVRWEQIRLLAGNAFGVAMLGLLEAIAMAKAIAARSGQKLDINQQCLSEGLANLTGSFFQCMPGSGSLTRSTINQQAGAVSQWSGVFSAAAVAATTLLFAPLAKYIPTAALAGLLLLAAFRMVDLRQLLFHLRATRFDAGIVLATALAAVFISVEFCIVIGVFLSFVLYIPRAARVQLTELARRGEGEIRERVPGEASCGRMLLYSLEGELFFGATPEIESHLATIEKAVSKDTRVVLLFLRRARNPDAAFLNLLDAFHQRLCEHGVLLLLAGVRDDLASGLRDTKLDLQIGQDCIIRESARAESSTREAIDRAYEVVVSNRCSTCPRKEMPV